MCLQYCYVTTSNSVVNYQDIFSVKFCAQCEYSKTCKPICLFCIWFCIVSVDPRLVIFAYLQVCEKVKKVSSFSTRTIWKPYTLSYVFGGVSLAGVSCRRRWPPPTAMTTLYWAIVAGHSNHWRFYTTTDSTDSPDSLRILLSWSVSTF